MKVDIKEEVEMSEGVTASFENGFLTIKGPKGEVKKRLDSIKIRISVEGNKVVFSAKKATKREKKLVNSFKAHVLNMIKGVIDGVVYKLKICASHFPMNVSFSNQEFVVKNFVGEKIPRKLKVRQGVDIKIDADIVNVEGVDKELVSQTAAGIEQLVRITDKDRRIFQDGIFIIEKDGKIIK